jgi:hypothetical protein
MGGFDRALCYAMLLIWGKETNFDGNHPNPDDHRILYLSAQLMVEKSHPYPQGRSTRVNKKYSRFRE